MNKLKNQVFTGKSIRSLEKNQYTFDVEAESTKKEIKDWIEKFFAVRVKNINSYRLPLKKRNGNLKFRVCRKRIIVTLQKSHSIPLFFNEQIS
uniref:Large ribosomal subunit protein uL23c n=1 Tax=Schizaea pectinata TaxID=148576 RepID=A0A286QHM0_9MONI|nr:ribosomal protein L23 [Schizaea pectinata]APT66105.1 ribosomal protein L23 [Schizaea pectinata]